MRPVVTVSAFCRALSLPEPEFGIRFSGQVGAIQDITSALDGCLFCWRCSIHFSKKVVGG